MDIVPTHLKASKSLIHSQASVSGDLDPSDTDSVFKIPEDVKKNEIKEPEEVKEKAPDSEDDKSEEDTEDLEDEGPKSKEKIKDSSKEKEEPSAQPIVTDVRVPVKVEGVEVSSLTHKKNQSNAQSTVAIESLAAHENLTKDHSQLKVNHSDGALLGESLLLQGKRIQVSDHSLMAQSEGVSQSLNLIESPVAVETSIEGRVVSSEVSSVLSDSAKVSQALIGTETAKKSELLAKGASLPMAEAKALKGDASGQAKLEMPVDSKMIAKGDGSSSKVTELAKAAGASSADDDILKKIENKEVLVDLSKGKMVAASKVKYQNQYNLVNVEEAQVTQKGISAAEGKGLNLSDSSALNGLVRGFKGSDSVAPGGEDIKAPVTDRRDGSAFMLEERDSAAKVLKHFAKFDGQEKSEFNGNMDQHSRRNPGAAFLDGGKKRRESASKHFEINSIERQSEAKSASAQSKVQGAQNQQSHSAFISSVISQIERIQKQEKVWNKVNFKTDEGESISLHLKIKGDTLGIKVGQGQDELKSLIKGQWGDIKRLASNKGIHLEGLDFEGEAKGIGTKFASTLNKLA